MTTELTRPDTAPVTVHGPGGPPPLDPALAHLSLPSVRAYRHMLAQEEFAAATWRRLIQAHLAALVCDVPDDGMAACSDLAPSCPGSGLAGWAHQLHDLDHELVGYCEGAHERLAQVTDELIARYHQDPSRCLSVLPVDRRATRR